MKECQEGLLYGPPGHRRFSALGVRPARAPRVAEGGHPIVQIGIRTSAAPLVGLKDYLRGLVPRLPGVPVFFG